MFTRRPLGGIAVLLVLAAWGCTEFEEDDSPHLEDWDTGHIEKLQVINYDLTSCQACHGAELNGTDEVDGCSSASCHTASQGQSALDAIYACDNCHGYIDSDPFADVVGNTSEDSLTVGTHLSHYANSDSLTTNVDCGSCHVVPDSVWAAGHIDTSLYAEVIFDTLATNDNSLTPVWDRQNATCTDTYCHGAFDFDGITGKDSIWVWTTPAAGDLCGTCHALPPAGHIASGDACGLCHSGVVSSQDHRTIIDPSKHINGLKNMSGN